MNRIIDPFTRREFGSCFYLVIPICEDDAEFNQLLDDASQVQKSVTSMLNGSMSVEDMLESVESFIPSMDDYVEEVETNMEQTLIHAYR